MWFKKEEKKEEPRLWFKKEEKKEEPRLCIDCRYFLGSDITLARCDHPASITKSLVDGDVRLGYCELERMSTYSESDCGKVGRFFEAK